MMKIMIQYDDALLTQEQVLNRVTIQSDCDTNEDIMEIVDVDFEYVVESISDVD